MKKTIICSMAILMCVIVSSCEADKIQYNTSSNVNQSEVSADVMQNSLLQEVSDTNSYALSVENYMSFADQLNDWTKIATDGDIEIYQSRSQSMLYKYNINLEHDSVVGYSYVHEPVIEYLTDDVIKIALSNGTNSSRIQYIRFFGGKVTNVSEQYNTYGYSIECISQSDCIVAYTGAVCRGDEIKTGVIVRDAFNGKELAVIVRDYFAAADVIDEMHFLNRSELSITYKIIAYGLSNDYDIMEEIVRF